MSKQQPWFRAIPELIRREVDSSLRIKLPGLRGIRTDKIKAYLECLTASRLSSAQASELVGVLDTLAKKAGGENGMELQVAENLRAAVAVLATNYKLAMPV